MKYTPQELSNMTRETLLTNEEEARVYAMQLSFSPALPMILSAVIDLGLLDTLEAAPGGLTAAELAAGLPVTGNASGAADMIDRMLHMLASFCVVTCSVRDVGDGAAAERVYEVAAPGRYLLKDGGAEGSVAGMLEINANPMVMKSWFHLKESVLKGGKPNPFEKAHGKPVFKYTKSDPGFNKLFNRGMGDMTKLSMKKVLETYEGFDGVHVLVDVGGGTGAFLNLVLSKYPSIKGINFDLPHVVQTAPAYPGIEHIGGDMFEKIPNGDAIMMKAIFHDWEDEHCVKILKRCHEALTEKGKVIIVESILPVGADPSNQAKYVHQANLTMMAMPNGKERTLLQFKSISEAVGFRSCQLVCCANAISVIELLK